jgi:hypothetical protein
MILCAFCKFSNYPCVTAAWGTAGQRQGPKPLDMEKLKGRDHVKSRHQCKHLKGEQVSETIVYKQVFILEADTNVNFFNREGMQVQEYMYKLA